jgi:cell volume regulation protein A
VLWTGLKGAVPVLLGTFIVQSGIGGANRAYEIIFVVVAFSVVVQGSLVPAFARWLRVPLRTIEPEPWSLGVRFREEPEGLHRFVIGPSAPADGTALASLACGDDTWVVFIIRDGELIPAHGRTRLEAGDEVLVQANPDDTLALAELFTGA